MDRFSDRCAIVTGGGQGIGKGCAMRLASEGARVAVVDIDIEAASSAAGEIEAAGGESRAYRVDVSSVDSIVSLVDSVHTDFGRIDILVNSAGIVRNQPFLEVSEEEWDRIISVNQKGTTFCIQAVAKAMVAGIPDDESEYSGRCHGKIVNFSSISGRRGRSLHVHYAASKAAIISITQSAALALAPYGINVNAVSPSVVMTKMWEQNDREKARILGLPEGEASKGFIERIPLRRAGTVADMAGAVAFLCSSDADYVTGQTLNVDGGFEMD
jgi:NAD(P)-dependent dehydrogenase (short-subunit alcohol dehydrogenase family)